MDKGTRDESGGEPFGAHRAISTLSRFSRQLRRQHTPQAISQLFVDVVEDELGFEFGAVLETDPATDLLRPLALSRQGGDDAFLSTDRTYVESHQPRKGHGITGWVAQTGAPVRIDDVRDDRRYHAVRDDIRSELCVPLDVGGRVLGVVNFETTSAGAYDVEDLHAMELLAPYLAVSLDRLQNYDALERCRQQLRHRARNRIASIVGLIDMMLQFPSSLQEFAGSLKSRLSAIAALESLLGESPVDRVDLLLLLEQTCSGGGAARVTLSGPPADVSSQALVPLVIVVNELLEIGAKRAVPATPSELEIEWKWDPPDGEECRRVRLAWRETATQTQGSGQQILDRLRFVESIVGLFPAGEVRWGFEDEGVCHEFVLALGSKDEASAVEPFTG